MRLAALLCAALAVSGCQAAERAEADQTPPAVPQPPDTGAVTKSDGCRSDAAGQTACLAAAFKIDQCSSMVPVSSMFRENESEGSFEYRTAYSAEPACLEALREAAIGRGFEDNMGPGVFALEPEPGYRELLIITDPTENMQGGIEWERAKQ